MFGSLRPIPAMVSLNAAIVPVNRPCLYGSKIFRIVLREGPAECAPQEDQLIGH